jgi:hypothetical protein
LREEKPSWWDKAWSYTIPVKPMTIVLLALAWFLFVFLNGCASKPYAEAEVKYAFPFSSDYWVHQDRSWACEPPQIDLEVGLEWRNGWSVAAYHESFLLCGSFNNKPEIYENGLLLKKKWGGQ